MLNPTGGPMKTLFILLLPFLFLACQPEMKPIKHEVLLAFVNNAGKADNITDGDSVKTVESKIKGLKIADYYGNNGLFVVELKDINAYLGPFDSESIKTGTYYKLNITISFMDDEIHHGAYRVSITK